MYEMNFERVYHVRVQFLFWPHFYHSFLAHARNMLYKNALQ